jgi:hypothetical protein
MNRVRWLNAQWPASMRIIGNRMKARPFTEDGVDGFAVERIREDFIEGRFIERYAYQEVNSDPFGKEEVVERVGYRSTEFTLFSQYPHIELNNGLRSIRDFSNRLLEACNFDLVVSPVTVNLLDWISTFQDFLGEKITVDSLQISGVELEPGITGKILLKGDKDVREAVEHIVGGKNYVLEKIQMKLDMGLQRVTVHLAHNGSAKVPPDHTSDLLPMLRKAIPQSKI